MFPHVIEAKHIKNHRVWLKFNDGLEGEVDFAGVLEGEVFEPLTDVGVFQAFSIQGHTLAWSSGADFSPEFLYDLLQQELLQKAV